MPRASLVVASAVLSTLTLDSPDLPQSLLIPVSRVSELDSSWSYDPQTGLLAFANDSGQPGLFLLDTRAGAAVPRSLPVPERWPRRPSLSPGGRWLTYHDLAESDQSWQHSLHLLDLRTLESRTLVGRGSDARVGAVAFSNDGSHLAYELGQEELGLVDLRTLAQERIASGPGVVMRSPIWSGDGETLFFAAGICIRSLNLRTRETRVVGCIEGAVALGSTAELALSPDQRSAAITVEHAGCPRIATVSMTDGRWAFLAGDSCAIHPAWLDARRLAYVGLDGDGSRLPRVQRLPDGLPEDLGFAAGVTYQLAVEPGGRILALLGAPQTPRSIWRLDPRGLDRPQMLFSPIPNATLGELEWHASTPKVKWLRADDGERVPVVVFRPRRPSGRGVLWVHGGPREDVAPRWYQEIEYFALAGITVVAVNYRGSTGYGTAFRNRAEDTEGQSRDLRAAAEYLRSLPDVDRDQMFLVAVCQGGQIRLTDANQWFRGIVQWTGTAEQWLDLPPAARLLWVSARHEAGARSFPGIVGALRARAIHAEWVEVPDGHNILAAANRQAALEASLRFMTLER